MSPSTWPGPGASRPPPTSSASARCSATRRPARTLRRRPLAAVLYRVSRADADLSRVPEELRDARRLSGGGPGGPAGPGAARGAARAGPREGLPVAGGRTGAHRGVRRGAGAARGVGRTAPGGAGRLRAGRRPGRPGPPLRTDARPGEPGHWARRARRASAPGPAARRRPGPGGRGGRHRRVPAVAAGRRRGGGKAPAKAAGPRVPGVDDRGPADGSGFVAQNAAQRPAGWKPWRAELGAPAFGCSAGEAALVCRTTDGRYEALDPAGGKRLWTADLVEDPRDDQSFIGPTGGVFVAGGTAVPAVHGPYAVLLSGGRLQVRDARSGAVRWEKEGPSGAGSRPGPSWPTARSSSRPATTRAAGWRPSPSPTGASCGPRRSPTPTSRGWSTATSSRSPPRTGSCTR